MKTKICTGECKRELPETEEFFSFRKDSNSFRKNCKDCVKKYAKDYRDKNRDKIRLQKQKDYQKNKENIKLQMKEQHTNFPWKRVLQNIKKRCENPKNPTYKWYGKRGIKNFLTEENIKFLWFRDKAYLMYKPSIDRKNSNKDYTLKNCKFIELVDNIIKSNKERNIKPILQFDLQGNFIREFKSIIEASRTVSSTSSHIIECAKYQAITAGGFKWEYKNE